MIKLKTILEKLNMQTIITMYVKQTQDLKAVLIIEADLI